MCPGHARILPRLYYNVNELCPRAHWDYDALSINWGDHNAYAKVRKIGRGKYSEVFLGMNLSTGQRCTIKELNHKQMRKVQRELKVLSVLKNVKNVVSLLDIVRDMRSGKVSLVFEFVNNKHHKILYPTFTDNHIRYYIFKLLRALDCCHSKGIMHRDVKPLNTMIDHRRKTLCLIDWGLAEFYHPDATYSSRVASRFYKAPELLLGLTHYHYSVDTWSVGCMLAGMTFKKIPFFRGLNNKDQLATIIKFCGIRGFLEYADNCGVKLPSRFLDRLRNCTHRKWSSLITSENAHLASSEAIDIIERMLAYDHTERILAKEALLHPYFDPIRGVTAEEGASALCNEDPKMFWLTDSTSQNVSASLL